MSPFRIGENDTKRAQNLNVLAVNVDVCVHVCLAVLSQTQDGNQCHLQPSKRHSACGVESGDDTNTAAAEAA